MYRIMFLESPKSWILKHNCPPGSQVRVCGARPYIFAWEAFVILCVCVYAVTFKRRTKHLSHLSKPDWHTINYFWPLRNELWKALIHSYASRQSTGSALQGAAYQGVNQTWNAAHGSESQPWRPMAFPWHTPAPIWSFCPRAPHDKAPSIQLPAPTEHAESHSSGIQPCSPAPANGEPHLS